MNPWIRSPPSQAHPLCTPPVTGARKHSSLSPWAPGLRHKSIPLDWALLAEVGSSPGGWSCCALAAGPQGSPCGKPCDQKDGKEEHLGERLEAAHSGRSLGPREELWLRIQSTKRVPTLAALESLWRPQPKSGPSRANAQAARGRAEKPSPQG